MISRAPAAFLESLIDACVMECYFREHMAERDLLFHDTVAQTILSGSFPTDPQTPEADPRHLPHPLLRQSGSLQPALQSLRPGDQPRQRHEGIFPLEKKRGTAVNRALLHLPHGVDATMAI
jgi:hypothetical protein